MKKVIILVILALCGITPYIADAQTLDRGPYLQSGTQTSINIRWRTSSSVVGVVKYGLSAENLDKILYGVSTTDHDIRIDGLMPGTRYYYSVGHGSTVLSGGQDNFFVTAPSGMKSTRIWVIGDAGTGNSNQEAVRDAYERFTNATNTHTDLWLQLGDNAYDKGTDGQYGDKMFNIYKSMLKKSVTWPAVGNHEWDYDYKHVHKDVFTLPGEEWYYSFDYSNIHFVCLNSCDGAILKDTSVMYQWLKADLAQNTKEWLIAYWHHPPYSKGSHLIRYSRSTVWISFSQATAMPMSGPISSPGTMVYLRPFVLSNTDCRIRRPTSRSLVALRVPSMQWSVHQVK
jgi:hypothetical protein